MTKAHLSIKSLLSLSIVIHVPFSFAAEIPKIGLNLENANYSDVSTDIQGVDKGIFVKASTQDVIIGDILANVSAGSSTNWGNIYGIHVDWSLNGYGVNIGDIDLNTTITAESHKFATAVYLGHNSNLGLGNITLGGIHGNLVAKSNIETATGIYILSSTQVSNITGNILATSNSGLAQGIMMQSQCSINNFSGVATVESLSGDVMGMSLHHDAFIKEFTGSIDAKSTSGDVIGLSLASNSSVGTVAPAGADAPKGMAGSIRVSSDSGVAKGMYVTAQNYTVITGDIEVSSNYEAIGIDLYNDAKLGDISKDSTITVTVNVGGEQVGNAYGIKGMDPDGNTGYAISDIHGEISVTNNASSSDANQGNAYGLYLPGEAKVGEIGLDPLQRDSVISVKSADEGKAFGIYTESSQTIYFEAGATVKASSQNGTHGYAVYNQGHDLSMAEAETDENLTINLQGNLYAGNNSIIFESGDYTISSDSWTASNIQVGHALGNNNFQTATVTVNDILSCNAESIDFYLNDVTDISQIFVADGAQLDLSLVTEVNFHFTENFMNEWGTSFLGTLYLASGSLSVLAEEDITVNMLGSEGKYVGYTIDSDEISIHTAISVPEPSTATLSLLALASLLARRRRA